MAAFDPSSNIRLLHEPTGYLLGRQVVDDALLDQFLADQDLNRQTKTEGAGERQAEAIAQNHRG